MAITLNGTTGIASTGAYSSDGISFADNTPADTLVTTTGGNVGIGTSSPTQKLDVAGSSTTATFIKVGNSAGSVLYGVNSSGNAYVSGQTSGKPLLFETDNTERMRIDSSGRVQVGTTNTSPASNDVYGITLGSQGGGAAYAGVIQASANGSSCLLLNRGSDNGNTAAFYKSGTNVGTISVTGSSTAYNTSSDYRLKENIAPMTGALAKVSALKPVTYTWKADGSDGQGFIAHELQEVCPDAVVGQKDAVDAEGNPQYQGIDTSFLVATLTAALQELNAKVDTLQAELATLKGQA